MLPPRSPRQSQVPSFTFFIAPACFWLVVVWFSFVGGRLRPWDIFVVVFFFVDLPLQAKRQHPPTRSAPVASPLQYPFHRRCWLLVGGWLLCPSIKRRPSKAKGPPISLFFCQLISHPKWWATVLPTCSDPALPLLHAPFNVDTVFHLIVAYIDETVAT